MSEIKKNPDDCETKEELEICCKFLSAKETELRIKVNEREFENKKGLFTKIAVAKAEYERVTMEVVRSFEGFPDRIREICEGVTPQIYNAMRSELERILDGFRDATLNLEPEPTTVNTEREREQKAAYRARKRMKG